MANKYYYDYNAPPKEATKMPPAPGTKGQSQAKVTKFVPQTDEPKKGL
jgi:hypothetical protein